MKTVKLLLIVAALASATALGGCKISDKSSSTNFEKPTTASTASAADTSSAVTEPITAAPTEAVTDAPTEVITEAPTEAVTEAPTEAPKTESVLFEENGIKIVFKGIGKDWLGQTAELRIENTSAKNYTVQTRDVSVNGFMVDPLFSCDVNSGKTANDQISFMESDFEKNDITSIEDIELSFHIFNADDWGEDFDSGTITIKP